MNRKEALDVLERRAFDLFLGCEEGIELEFKGEPYRLGEDTQKFELAKDVSAMANAQGGVIVIGVRTESQVRAPVDVAVALRPVRRDLLDEVRTGQVIAERIYPRISGLVVAFHPSHVDDGAGLLTIDVPPQPVTLKYFLVQRPVADDGRVRGWLVGVMIRGIGEVHEQRVGELHSAINGGLNVGRQLSELADMVAALRERLGDEETVSTAVDPGPAARLDDVVAQRLNELDS
ncbi:MAG: hypothetical protein JWR63_3031 [Conexibacter sp.]|nr:hypothetical protein [Conexibacter sp.]